MNNFPAMTEAQVMWMIAHCARVMSESSPDDFEYLTAQIALAALTAEPVGWMVKYGGIDKEMFVNKQAAARLYHDVTENGFLDVVMLQLYTAPPAPVLKPIELPKKYVCDKNGCDDDLLPSWQVMISCDEIIAAIRAAGYEVKP